MKNQTRVIIFVLGVVFVLGILGAQILSLTNSYILKNENFDLKVQRQLDRVVYAYRGSTMNKSVIRSAEDAIINIDSNLLQDLLKKEFETSAATQNYVYSVYSQSDGYKILLINKDISFNQILFNSPNQISLFNGALSSKRYYLSVYFPNKKMVIYDQLFGDFFIFLSLLLMLSFGFVFVIRLINKQKRQSLLRNDVMSSMIHELKTPISTVSVSSEMLMHDVILQDISKAQKYAKVVFHENKRLKNLVDQVLQVAILDKSEFPVRKEKLDLHKIIMEVSATYNVVLVARNGQLDLRLEAVDSIINVDRIQLINILNNLLENANKYTKENPIINMSTKNLKHGVLLSIRDNGIGVKKENQLEIFNKFYRVNTEEQFSAKAYGLGLYYVKSMMELFGGDIKINSEFGKGSVFELFFPIKNEFK
ncbi:MAG: hypothetical protein B7C24_08365 [Bacteroidetes bacterium 4572_77]|nr:MAG: hypothetical protein B7C24_08365 [Bacteroidetes bacterium 4572_77]